jgi:hypothetical protein
LTGILTSTNNPIELKRVSAMTRYVRSGREETRNGPETAPRDGGSTKPTSSALSRHSFAITMSVRARSEGSGHVSRRLTWEGSDPAFDQKRFFVTRRGVVLVTPDMLRALA